MTKILLVEDDKSLREIYGVRLLAEGYDIISAGDGEEALAMSIKDRPSLIVSDVMMPKISGFDMLDILRSTTETRDIKVIMMTALSSEEQRQRGVALGADRYLVKSQVGIEDVVRTVHEVLGDAPVTGQQPLATPERQAEPTPAPAPDPMPAPAPVQQPVPQNVQQPGPGPRPMPTTPAPQQFQQAPQPISAPPRPNLADRVIQPLQTERPTTPDFSHLMSQELSQASSVPTPAPVAPPTQQQPTAPSLSFEETPLTTPANQASPQTPPLPPVPPAPNPGV